MKYMLFAILGFIGLNQVKAEFSNPRFQEIKVTNPVDWESTADVFKDLYKLNDQQQQLNQLQKLLIQERIQITEQQRAKIDDLVVNIKQADVKGKQQVWFFQNQLKKRQNQWTNWNKNKRGDKNKVNLKIASLGQKMRSDLKKVKEVVDAERKNIDSTETILQILQQK